MAFPKKQRDASPLSLLRGRKARSENACLGVSFLAGRLEDTGDIRPLSAGRPEGIVSAPFFAQGSGSRTQRRSWECTVPYFQGLAPAGLHRFLPRWSASEGERLPCTTQGIKTCAVEGEFTSSGSWFGRRGGREKGNEVPGKGNLPFHQRSRGAVCKTEPAYGWEVSGCRGGAGSSPR